jgi:hypothetical protein
MLEKEIPSECKLIVTQYSVVETMRSLIKDLPNQSHIMELVVDIVQTDTKDGCKPKMRDLKMELESHLPQYSKFLKKIYCFKKYWMLYKMNVFSGGLHTYNRTGTIIK